MSDKTIIDHIQARADQVDAELAHADRATLLAILAEVGELPEKWQSESGHESSERANWSINIRADELQAILKRTNQQGED